jgi:hypothetical protein
MQSVVETQKQQEERVKDSQFRVRPLRVLFGVSSVGLGHVRRDIAIAAKIRELAPAGVNLKLDWVTAEPALSFLVKRGENALESSQKLESMSSFFENDSERGKIADMSKVASDCEQGAKRNYEIIKPFLSNYDVLIQDEFYETLFSFMWDKQPVLPPKSIVLTDYVRFDTDSANPFNKLKITYANRQLKKAYLNQQLRIFLDYPDALPEASESRKWVAENFHVLGPVVSHPPSEPKSELTKTLFGETKSVRFVVFTVGGTAIGKSLIQFLIKNADFLSERLDAYLVVLLGPRIKASDLKEVESTRISLIPFTYDSMKYFKLAECVVTQGGASSLYEIASLGVPCVVIPIENHFEQEQNAERFAARFGFETLEYSSVSITNLEKAVKRAIRADKYEPHQQTRAAEGVAKLFYNLVGL